MISLFILIVMSNGHYIPYQAHGFNDLAYFMQQIKKGTTYFKMDVAPATRDSCINYSNWVPSSGCEVFSSGFEICCLTFRGDTASIPIFKQEFNISSELFEVVKNNPSYFDKNTPTKVIAFNFQYSDKFAVLTKTFLASLVDLMEQYNIQIIIGSNGFWQAYIDKCQTSCDAIERKIANAKFYFQTGSTATPTNPKDKNFNVFYEEINRLCEQGWPEWNDQFGMIFWEPSHEYQVQLCRQKFESPTCKISDNLRKVENLRIASNLEPETMQIYWKKLQQDKDSFDLTDNKHILNGEYKTPKIEYVSSCDQYLTTYQFNGQSVIQIKDQKYQTVFSLTTNLIINQLNIDGTTFLVQGSTAYEIYSFQGCSKFVKISSGEVKQNQVLSIVQREQKTELVVVTFYADLQEALIEFLDATTRVVNGITKIQNISAQQNVVIDTVYQYKYFIALSYTKESQLNSEDVLKKIYLTLIQITPDYLLLKYLPAQNNVDYGTIGEVKLAKLNNQVFVASIQSDGLCQSAILLNNNEWNKCQFVNQEEYASLINVDHMINYYWGKWDDVWDRVSTGTPINGCDFKVMHAKLGNGDKPSIAIKNGEAVVVTEFVHYEQQGAFTQLFCGSSNDYPGVSKGILTFSFDLVKAEDL